MSERLTWEAITLQLRNPFRLSYGVSETRRAFWLRLPGDEGWGEGTIPSYYHISEDDMAATWAAAAARAADQAISLPDDPADIPAWVGEDGPAPARSALDLALHDRIARQRGVPLHALLGLPPPPALPTSFTVAIAEPAEMARLAAEASRFSAIKVKLGGAGGADADGAGDAARLAAVRAARPDARLRIDANAGWTPAEAVERLAALERFGLEMVEQPVAKEDFAGLGYVQAHTAVPVVADESLCSLADLERLHAAGVRAVNLKLMKVGGLAPGLRIARRARALGMRIMLGCMIETSLGVTAMAHLAALADWLDLDAPLLIANDPFDGIRYDAAACVHLPDRAGIGAVQR